MKLGIIKLVQSRLIKMFFMISLLIIFVGFSTAHNHKRHYKIGSNKEFIWLYRTRRSPPVCAALVDSNSDVRRAVAELYSPSRKSSLTLNYLSSVEQEEIKEYHENCGNEDYYFSNSDIMPGLTQTDRALCPFRVHVNTDSQRIPKDIPEVQCLCNLPRNGRQGENSGSVICEQVFFEMTVLKFNKSCSEYKETKEKLVLACIPVYRNSRTTDPNIINDKITDGDIIT